MTRNSQVASENAQNYSINTMEGFSEGSASFLYRGYEISFSTMGYNKPVTMQSVLVYPDNGKGEPVYEKLHTVEEAIKFVDSQYIA